MRYMHGLLLAIVGCSSSEKFAKPINKASKDILLPFSEAALARPNEAILQKLERIKTPDQVIEAIRNDPRSKKGMTDKNCVTNGGGYAVSVRFPTRDPIWGGDHAIFILDQTFHVMEVHPTIQPNR